MPRVSGPKDTNKGNNEPQITDNGHKSAYMKDKCATIGKNIREQRKLRKFSVENLAEFLELSASYIGLLERGDRCPSLKIVYKLGELFGITPDALLIDKSEEDSDELNVAEGRLSYNAKPQVATIAALISTMNENELDFVMDTVKNLKRIGK